MNAGELNKRIKIQTMNEDTEAWSDLTTAWAAVTNLFGSEYFQAAAVHSENTVKFTIRYLAGIDTYKRIIFQDKIYNIISVDNIKYDNAYIEIKALEVSV